MSPTRVIAAKFFVFAAVASMMLVLLHNTMVDDVDGDTARYHALFTEVSGLREGDDVRIAGVKVGRVQEIGVVGDRAEIGFTVSREHALTSTTGLVLRYQNLIGQRYLAVLPGSEQGERIEPGATIPVERTSPGFDLTALLNGFRPLFQVLQPADVNALSESIVKVLQGEGGTVAGLLRETSRLTSFLADRDQLFHDLAANLTPVLEEVSGNGELLADTVRELSALTRGLARDRGTFAGALDQLEILLGRTDAMVSELRAPMRRDIRALRAVLRTYAGHSEEYGASFAHVGSVFEILGRVASYRSGINTLFCTTTLSAEGVEVPVGPSGRASEVCR
jgi:phospholipid/cholesterol/gamma-HCH transport system substrate-binding protein